MDEIHGKIYVFVVDSTEFLKTIEKLKLKNEQTAIFYETVRKFKDIFNNFYENKSNLSDHKSVIISLLEEIKNFLIKNFEDINDDITFEKSNLYRQANEILSYFTN